MVRTELSVSTVAPGGTIAATVEVTGGDHDVSVGYLALGLVARVGVQNGHIGDESNVEFHQQRVAPGFRLLAGERRVFDVTCDVPLETPPTLPGTSIGLRTLLEVAREVDKTDLDPLTITELPAQQHIMDALMGLGFTFLRSDVERGTLPGVPQTLPFYQEIEFLPGPSYAAFVNQLEATFIATPADMHVVLELDRKVGILHDRDLFGHFVVSPGDTTDWRLVLSDWLSSCRVPH